MFKTMIRKCVYILVLFVFLFSLQSFTVVIDAGHGGQDVGAVGLKMGIQEKDLNLAVAKQLAEKIRANYPDVNVILTRDKDVFLTLQNRADIVNKCRIQRNCLLVFTQMQLTIVTHVALKPLF
jgi:N-acetylmuramoyl-L-alanine amidase